MACSINTPKMDTTNSTVPQTGSTHHKLYDNWTLWAHLPHDIDWTLKSYKEILTFNSVEAAIAVTETLPEKMVQNCMLFLMRKGIQPIWEDPKNINGGCFSYKISNKYVANVWRNLSYILVGESLTDNGRLRGTINGITISPKKNFCVIKIWLAGREFQNPTSIIEFPNFSAEGCLFKTHSDGNNSSNTQQQQAPRQQNSYQNKPYQPPNGSFNQPRQQRRY